MFGLGAASPPRIRLSLGSVAVVSCRSPCPCVSRLPALSVDGASQNVQVARRPSVCRGNWLPVELFPGKRALLTPSIARTARLLTPAWRKKATGCTLGATCCWIWGVFSRNTWSFFPTPALTKAADGCMIGEEAGGGGVWLEMEHMLVVACKSQGMAR